MHLIDYQQLAADVAHQRWAAQFSQQLNVPAFWRKARAAVRPELLPRLIALENTWRLLGPFACYSPEQLITKVQTTEKPAGLLENLIKRLQGYADKNNRARDDWLWDMARSLSRLDLIAPPVITPRSKLTPHQAAQFIALLNTHGQKKHHEQLTQCRWFQSNEDYTVTRYGHRQVLVPERFKQYIPWGGNRWWSRWLFWTRHHVIKHFALYQLAFFNLRQLIDRPSLGKLSALHQSGLLNTVISIQTQLVELERYYQTRLTWYFNWYHKIDRKLAIYCRQARATLLDLQCQLLQEINVCCIEQGTQPGGFAQIQALRPNLEQLLAGMQANVKVVGSRAQEESVARLQKAIAAHIEQAAPEVPNLFYPSLALIARGTCLPNTLAPDILRLIKINRLKAEVEAVINKPPTEARVHCEQFDQAWASGFKQVKHDLQAVLLSPDPVSPELMDACLNRLIELKQFSYAEQSIRIQQLLQFSISKLFKAHFVHPFPDLTKRLDFLRTLAEGELKLLLKDPELQPQCQAYCQQQHAMKHFAKLSQKLTAKIETWCDGLDSAGQSLWQLCLTHHATQLTSQYYQCVSAPVAQQIKFNLKLLATITALQQDLRPDTAIKHYVTLKHL